MAWAPILKLLVGKMGAGAAGGAAGGTSALGGGFGAAASRFAVPGAAGNVNGTPMPQTQGGASNLQPGGYAQGPSIGGATGMPAQQQGASQQQGLLKTHENLTRNVNGFFDGLRMFGNALGGLDKTPLNAIRLTQPQVLNASQIQNPGELGLAALMQRIIGGN